MKLEIESDFDSLFELGFYFHEMRSNLEFLARSRDLPRLLVPPPLGSGGQAETEVGMEIRQLNLRNEINLLRGKFGTIISERQILFVKREMKFRA